ncbi:MAG: argininosuccinate lyase, partial [Chloroflexi bacterium]|nr:argininosuccinate lyase [Chloroflexota bacterium]
MTGDAGEAQKLWGGRFEGATDALVEAFTASIDVDRRLYREDIAASIAHATMLARQSIISAADRDAIVEGLAAIREEIAAGRFAFRADREDIHLHVEAALAERIGAAAGRLHTARSRNDQVATDLRLWARGACDAIAEQLGALRSALLLVAEREAETVIPGYTHLQRAQPVLLAHHMLAHEAALARDSERVTQARARLNVLPLGAGALAGVSYPIDRDFVARELGFDTVAANSLDAVADRDFVVELHACAALAMVHLSRIAEEVVLWSTTEFGLVRVPDAFATGSSIMPQKKNPDVAELVRGRSARVIGQLVQALTLLKALPLAYNRDLQEDKAPLFDSVDTLLGALAVMAALVPALAFDRERGRTTALAGFALATDYADYLARRGVPFREAHAAVGALVARCEREGRALEALTLDELRAAHPAFEADALALDLDT